MNSFLAVVLFCAEVDKCVFYSSKQHFRQAEECQKHLVTIFQKLDEAGFPFVKGQCLPLGISI